MRLWRTLASALALGWAGVAAAEPQIQPSERVVRGVNVRAEPGVEASVIDRLEPGETAQLLEVIPGWNKVLLPDGRQGYVSKAWTVTIGPTAPLTNAPYRLRAFDVGTGLAVFLEGPDFNFLYDAGSNDDTARQGSNRVVAYLRRARPNLQKIDHVVVSHPHKDHVELLPDVLATYQVGHLWDSGRTNPICSYRTMLRQVRDRGIAYHDAEGIGGDHVVNFESKVCYGRALPAEQVIIPHAAPIQVGQSIPLGRTARMTFLHATASGRGGFNENSLVLAVDVGRTRVLFMGDAEAGGRKDPSILPSRSSVEGELIACCRAQLRSDVLIVGHHGSKTSSRRAFLDAAGAYVFVVSAGPTRYGSVTLPDAEVIKELEERGTVYRTDNDDAACLRNNRKVGPDNDNQPGGCDSILIALDGTGRIEAVYEKGAD